MVLVQLRLLSVSLYLFLHFLPQGSYLLFLISLLVLVLLLHLNVALLCLCELPGHRVELPAELSYLGDPCTRRVLGPQLIQLILKFLSGR